MFGLRRNLLAAILIAVVTAGAMLIAAERSRSGGSTAPLAAAAGPPPPSPPQTAAPGVSPDTAGLQDDIGAVLVVSQSGTAISPVLQSMVLSGRVGGVLLFASNFKNPAGLQAWTDRLRALASTACLAHPILVMVDEEAGGGTREKLLSPRRPG